MFPPLPQPPNNPMPTGQSVGGFTGPAPGTLPYRPSPAAQAIGGIGSFVQSYLASREATKGYYDRKWNDALDAMQKGLLNPNDADIEKIMKWGKRAGHDWLRTEPYTPEEKAQQQSQAAQQAYNPATMVAQMAAPMTPQPMNGGQNAPGQIPAPGGPGMPGIPSPPQGPMMAPQMSGMPTPQQMPNIQQGQPSAPPSFWERAAQKLGISTGPVSAQSSSGDMLRQLAAAGQAGGGAIGKLGRGNVLDAAQTTNQTSLQGLLSNAISHGPGSDQSMEMLFRTGSLKDLPLDNMKMMIRSANPQLSDAQVNQLAGSTALYMASGGPALRMEMLKMSKELAPTMGNNVQTSMQYLNDIMSRGMSQITPGMSPEQFKQYEEGRKVLFDSYPTAPSNLVNLAALGKILPNGEKLSQLAEDTISKLPRTAQNLSATDKAHLGFDYTSLGERTENDHNIYNAQVMAEVRKVAGSEIETFQKAMQNGTPDQQRNAYQGLANALSRQGTMTMKYYDGKTTRDIEVGDPAKSVLEYFSPLHPHGWMTGQPGLAPTGDAAGAVSKAIGQATPNKVLLPQDGQLVQQLVAARGMNQEEAKFVVRAARNYHNMPEETRSIMLDQNRALQPRDVAAINELITTGKVDASQAMPFLAGGNPQQ